MLSALTDSVLKVVSTYNKDLCLSLVENIKSGLQLCRLSQCSIFVVFNHTHTSNSIKTEFDRTTSFLSKICER